MKRMFLIILLTISLISSAIAFADDGFAEPYFTPVEVNSHLPGVRNKPGILLIIHDLNQNKMKPFFFEFNADRNFYFFNIGAREYKVLAAQLITNQGHISNFCDIKQGVIVNRSLAVSLSGAIDKHTWDLRCRARYRPQF